MRPCFALGFDLDSLDVMLQSRGWAPRPGTNMNVVYDRGIPRILELCAALNVRATFFVVGRDLRLAVNRARIAEAERLGHEIANHTANHIQNFLGLDAARRRAEIEAGKKAAEDAAQAEVVGFRAPGWNIDRLTLELVRDTGHVYDASVVPSPWLPLLRFFVLLKNRMKRVPVFEQHIRPARRNRPFRVLAGGLWEMPVCTLPFVHLPFWGAVLYARPAIAAWLAKGGAKLPLIHYEGHGLEFVDPEELGDERFQFKPGMRQSAAWRMDQLRAFASQLQQTRECVTLRDGIARGDLAGAPLCPDQ